MRGGPARAGAVACGSPYVCCGRLGRRLASAPQCAWRDVFGSCAARRARAHRARVAPGLYAKRSRVCGYFAWRVPRVVTHDRWVCNPQHASARGGRVARRGRLASITLAELQSFVAAGAKGNPAKIPEPGSGTDDLLGCEPLVRRCGNVSTGQVRRGNATRPGDADGGFRKSYLFSRSGRGPGNLSEGDRVLAFNARNVSNTGRHRENSRQALENPGEGHAEVTRRFVPISAAGLRGAQPLVDRTM